MSLDMEVLLDAVRRVESGGNANAVSPAGAKGPYQFMDATAKEYGVSDPFDERQSREGARRYLTDLMKQFGTVEKALAAYNGGPGRLAENGGNIAAMPRESRDYVSKVMSHYQAGVITTTAGDHTLFPAKAPVPTVDTLFPGEKALRRRAAGELFPVNRENEALMQSVLNPKGVSEASRIYQLQLRTGLPTGVIERNLDTLEAQVKRADFDAEKFRAKSPLLAQWLTENPARASLAQGDYESLTALEQVWETMKAIPAGVAQGYSKERLMTLNYKEVRGELTPQEQMERRQLKIEQQISSQEFDEGAPSWAKAAADVIGLQIGGMVARGSDSLSLGGEALGTSGRAKVVATALEHDYGLAVGEAYDDLENAKDSNGVPIDPTAARYAALLVAVPNTMLEFVSLHKALKVIPGIDTILGKLSTQAMKKLLVRPTVTRALADFGKKYAVAVGTETFTEGMQKLLNILSREMATGDLGEGLSGQDAEAIAAESTQAFKGAVVLGALASGPRVIELYNDMQKADKNEQFMLSLGETAASSKTFSNSPDAFGEYVEKLKENGPVKNVFIPIQQWDLLFQDKAPDAAKEVFGDLKQYTEAKAVGGDLVIPIETYAKKLAGTEFHAALIPDIRLSPGEMTPREADEAMKAEPEILAVLQQELAEKEAAEVPLSAIYDDVFGKMREAGVSQQEANRIATMEREHMRALAAYMEVDPLKLYMERPLQIQREAMRSQLQAYNQQLVEPAIPTPQRLPLEGGEINLPPATPEETTTAVEALAAAEQSNRDYGAFGATYHPTKGNLSGTEGVAVAGYPQRGVITEGAPTAEEIETFMRRNRDIFQADPNAALGLWVDTESGKGYIDIANVLPRDLAIAQGESLGEIAVWDLGAFEEIRLPVQRDTGQQMLFQSAFHGTRHHFDKFSLEHLGEGEGAQVFGWGLYFASERAVAESYRKQLTEQLASPFITIKVNGDSLRDFLAPFKDEIKPVLLVKAGSYMQPIANGGTWDNVFANLYADRDKQLRYADEDSIDAIYANFDGIEKVLHILQKQEISVQEPEKGQVYKVELPDEKAMLRWDEPLSQQPEIVQDAVEAIVGFIPGDPDGRTIYQVISDKLKSDKEASIALNAFGVPGLKYLDGSSRSRGEGSYNFVIFDDNAIEIVETYYQGERGASVPAKNLMVLFEGADPSTPIHELGHLWLEELRDFAMRPEASEKLKQHWETVKAEFGMTDGAITVDQHERFARSLEAYVMEGKSPSFQLSQVFSELLNWMLRIYKSAKMLDVNLTDEMRNVFDHLLATEEAIQQSREHHDYESLMFDDSIMTPEEAAAYNQLRDEAKSTAENNFRARVMKELRREKLQAWRDEKKALAPKVRAEILEQPIYRAAYWLWSGKLPDGSEIPDMAATKLDKQSLLDMGVTLSDLPFRYQENGLHPDVVADLFGFPTGESLVKELIGLPTLKDAIETEVSRRIREEHGGIIVEGTTMEEAAMEVQNTRQIEVFNMELRILKRLGARREKTHPAVLKDIARKIIQRKTLRELNPRLYEEAAIKAGQEAQEALLGREFRSGTGRNLDIAYDAKQKQMLNIFLFREATEKRKQADKSIKKWKRFLFRSDARLARTYDMNMVNAARAIASVHGLGTANDTASNYMRTMAQYDPETYNDMKDIVEMASSDGRKLDDLMVSEFEVVRDAIEGLWALARRSKQIEIDGKRLEKDDVIQQLNGRTAQLLAPGRKRAGYDRAVTKWDKTKMLMLGGRAMLRRVEHWVDAMDGGDPKGVFRSFIWQPISEAADAYRDHRRVILEKYMALAESFPKESSKAGKIDATELRYEFNSKAELLGALLHTGNESNFQKLLRGREWGAFVDDELDSSKWDAFIERMWKEGVLTEADYKFVQGVWDLFEELKPEAQKIHKDVYGYYFSEVTAQPIKTPFGTFRGGYYPARVDPFIVEDAAIRQEKEAMETQPSSFLFPSPAVGFTKHRNEAYAKPLSLDIGLISQNFETELKFIHLKKATRDIGRVAIDKDFRSMLSALDSEVASVMLMPWLQRSAMQIVEIPSGPKLRLADSFAHAVRTRTGLQYMAVNASVALQQITGLAMAANKVKLRYLASALWRYTRSPIDYSAQIHASSKFMNNRVSTQLMDVQRRIDNILLNPNPFQKAEAFAKEHAYFLQTGMQSMVDTITWAGAYEQATEAGATENEAVRQADSAVRETQGSFAPEDISRIEAGTPFTRCFTMFYSFFNMSANMLGTEFANAMQKGGLQAGGRALYVYTFGFLIPAVLAEGIVQAMGGQLFDDEDDDGYLDNILSVFFGGQARMATAMVPIIGSAVQVGINEYNSKWYDDAINLSPAVSTLAAAGKTAVGYPAYQLIANEDARVKGPIKDILTAVGMATGLPLAPLAKPIGYITDIEQGFIKDPENPVDFARGLISGRAPE